MYLEWVRKAPYYDLLPQLLLTEYGNKYFDNDDGPKLFLDGILMDTLVMVKYDGN